MKSLTTIASFLTAQCSPRQSRAARFQFSVIVVLALNLSSSLLTLPCWAQETLKRQSPNIIVVMADDLGLRRPLVLRGNQHRNSKHRSFGRQRHSLHRRVLLGLHLYPNSVFTANGQLCVPNTRHRHCPTQLAGPDCSWH